MTRGSVRGSRLEEAADPGNPRVSPSGQESPPVHAPLHAAVGLTRLLHRVELLHRRHTHPLCRYNTLRVSPTLAWRLGGKKIWGEVPFQDAATIGGKRSVRGYFRDRFSGESSLYGSADLCRAKTISVSPEVSEERVATYFQAGFAF